MSGSVKHRASSRGAHLATKAFTLFLSFAFALALVPTAAWASFSAQSEEPPASAAASEAAAAAPADDAPSGTGADGTAAAFESESAAESDDASASDPAVSSPEAADASAGAVQGAASGASPVQDDAQRQSTGAVQAGGASADAVAAQAQVEVTASIIGVDASGADQVWAPATDIELPEGSTAADLSEALFERAGIAASYNPDGQYGWELESITSPSDPDLTLAAWDPATQKMWQLYINGEPSDLGAGSVTLNPGDAVVWYYSLWGAELPDEDDLGGSEPSATVEPTVSVIGKVYDEDPSGTYEYWMHEVPVSVPSGSSMKDVLSAAFDKMGLAYAFGTDMGSDIVSSLTSPDGQTTNAGNSFACWYVFRNGEMTGWWGELGGPVSSAESIVLCFNSSSIPDIAYNEMHARVRVIGPDANGVDTFWGQTTCSVPLEEGAQPSAWDASAASFGAMGLQYDASDSEYGTFLNTITSPFTGDALGFDAGTGKYWQLFIDGEASLVGASGEALAEGMTVTWYYAADGAQVPSDDELNRIATSFLLVDASSDELPDAWVPRQDADATAGTRLGDYLKDRFEAAGVQATMTDEGGSLSLEELAFGDDKVLASGDNGCEWAVFVNGEPVDDSSYAVQDGDEIQVEYGADDVAAAIVTVQASVIGEDAAGNPLRWADPTPVSVYEGATGVQVAQATFAAAGLSYQIKNYGDEVEPMSLISAVTSADGMTLASGEPDEWYVVSGKGWYPYVNGTGYDIWLEYLGKLYGEEGSESGHAFATGDEVVFYYSYYRSELPPFDGGDDFETDPDAPRPDWDSSWPGFGTGVAATDAPTPSKGAEEAWVAQIKDPEDYLTDVSDPILVGDYLYIAAGTELQKRSLDTGEVLASGQLASDVDSISRMVYADGVIVVPLSGGRLQALTADELVTVWVTAALPQIDGTGTQQSLGSLTVANGCVYFATSTAGGNDETFSGYALCVSLEDGSTVWSNARSGSGYYWSGMALSGDWAVLAGDSGELEVLDASTGEKASALDLGAGVRSAVVAGTQENTVLVASKDGVLHKVLIDPQTGAAQELASVKFGSSTTSTPTVVDGKVYIGGASLDGVENEWGFTVYGGALAVIDEASMTVDHSVTTYGGGEELPGDSKSSPLVSTQDSGIYVYFTCNAQPGGLYLYKVGDAEATMIYLPEESLQNYSMSSVVCGADGVLYYINDSGALFAVAPSDNGFPTVPDTPSDGGDGDGGADDGSDGADDGPDRGGDPATDPAATVPFAPTSTPVARPAAAPASAAAGASDGASAAAVARQSAADLADGASGASDPASSEAFPGWLPVAGIAVGIGGLAVASGLVVWVYRRR